MPSEQNGKTSDDILEELFSSIKTESASESSHNEVGSSSEEDEERRERKKKKSHKHKKSKKKKKKHKRSRSDSRSRDRSASDETSKRKKRDSQRKIKTAPLSPVREVKREPLSPPASYRSDYYPSDDRHASKHRRVPPPPPPEEWVKKESSSRYEEDRHSERDRYSRHRERSSRSRERSRFRDHSRSRDHSSRRRDHSRSRDRSSRHRDRSRSRNRSSRHKDRSRERDRSRSRDRSGRNKDRSRERDRSRSRDRKSRRKDRSRSRDEAHSRKRRTSTDERPPKRTNGEEDPFWESKWEAMQVQSAADEKEKKGRLFLQPERQKVRTPTPEFDRDSSPETSELKNLKRLKEIENLVVKENEKYVAEPPNPDMFEWDEKTKMRRKKIIPEPKKEPESSDDEDADKKIDPSSMTLDEIEELQRKKDKKKKKKEAKEEGEIVDRKSGSREKEDGELRSDDEDRHTRSRSKRSDRKFRERSRSRDYRRRSPKGYGYRDRRVRSRSRDRFRDHRRRSRSRSRDGGDGFRGSRAAIDKAKLLAIAQKNAVKLLNSNDLKGMNKDRLVAIKSGGQSLSELTIFCRELAKKGITDEFSDEEAVQESDEEKELNHPFMVRDRPLPNPILLGIQGMKNQAPANGLTLSTMTPAMRDAARSHRLVEFPVSSGNAHRVKEDDVEDEEAGKVPTGMLAAQTAVTALVAAGDPIVSTLKIEPKIEGVTMSNPLGALMFGGAAAPLALPAPRVPTPPPPIPAFEFSPETTNEETKDTVFETKINPSMDISTIISVRLNAMKRLSSNPNDPEALRELYDAQQEMSKWADSKNKPGQFTGTTGAKILSKGELLTGVQAWAKQEQFTTAQKVSGGFGEYMLRKMGWREGDGLGKERSGTVDPLQLDIKMDKRGLMAPEEGAARKKGGVLTMTGLKDVSGKHPVTAIIEVSTKKRWGPPTFAQVFECGVAHRKQYIWKVTVNGVEYQPTIASDNKKKAKANAATVALQELGMLPKDPNNPL